MTALRDFQLVLVDAPRRPRRSAPSGRRPVRTGRRAPVIVAAHRRARLLRGAVPLLVSAGQLLLALWAVATLGFWVLIAVALVR